MPSIFFISNCTISYVILTWPIACETMLNVTFRITFLLLSVFFLFYIFASCMVHSYNYRPPLCHFFPDCVLIPLWLLFSPRHYLPVAGSRPLFPQWSHHVYPQFLPGGHPAHRHPHTHCKLDCSQHVNNNSLAHTRIASYHRAHAGNNRPLSGCWSPGIWDAMGLVMLNEAWD